MIFETWHIWIIISIIFVIIEIFVPTFLAISLAVGCLTSGIMAYLGLDFIVQLIAFAIGTLVSFFLCKTFYAEVWSQKQQNKNKCRCPCR